MGMIQQQRQWCRGGGRGNCPHLPIPQNSLSESFLFSENFIPEMKHWDWKYPILGVFKEKLKFLGSIISSVGNLQLSASVGELQLFAL